MNKLSNSAYKNYLLDNKVLTTNAVADEKGVKFIQPTIKTSSNITSKQNDKGVPSVKKNQPKQQTSEVLIDEESGSQMMSLNSSMMDQMRAAAAKANADIAVDSSASFENEMKSKYSAEAVSKAGSFKDTHDTYKMLLGEDNEVTLAKAKQEYENQIKSCL